MCHERWALHVFIKRKFFYIYFSYKQMLNLTHLTDNTPFYSQITNNIY